jgi:porin
MKSMKNFAPHMKNFSSYDRQVQFVGRENFPLIMMKILSIITLSVIFLLITPLLAHAYDINDKFSLDGTLTGVYQYGDWNAEDVDDAGRGAAVLDLGANFHPTEIDEFQVTLGFAAGNALNNIAPFSLTPYADDLEDDLKNINGRNRDYLLEAWYKHTFSLSENTSLGITGGIIDSTAYIDDNKFANDECSQFMNEAFVNHKNVNLPSYDLGGVIELDISNVSIRGLVMNTKYEADVDTWENYNYFALQLGYSIDTGLGEGNYRLLGFTTNSKFPSWEGTDYENLYGFGISADQELGTIFGVFARLGWQDDSAVIDHDAIYSAGVNISGTLWGRENDEAGIGYAYLNGSDEGDIDNTNAFEAYARFQLTTFSDITVDIQYMADDYKHEEDINGFIYGVRVNAYF